MLVVDKSKPHALHCVQRQAVSVTVSAIDENALMGKVEHINYGMCGEERCQLARKCNHEKYERKRRKEAHFQHFRIQIDFSKLTKFKELLLIIKRKLQIIFFIFWLVFFF